MRALRSEGVRSDAQTLLRPQKEAWEGRGLILGYRPGEQKVATDRAVHGTCAGAES